MRVFVAGASGVIGRRLVRLLIEAGHEVVGTTRSKERAEWIRSVGAEAVLLDAFNAGAVAQAVALSGATVVVHQMTDLGNGFAADQIAETLDRNARIRTVGTVNLVNAALEASVVRFVAQSIAWLYGPGRIPHSERSPLDPNSDALLASTIAGVRALEHAVICSYPQAGVVLRYGHLYGPGTGHDSAVDPVAVHVDAAAHAAVLAVESGEGVYNVVEENPSVDCRRAVSDLAWNADFRTGPQTKS